MTHDVTKLTDYHGEHDTIRRDTVGVATLLADLVAPVKPRRPESLGETCLACGCLCLPDERCPSCESTRLARARAAAAAVLT